MNKYHQGGQPFIRKRQPNKTDGKKRVVKSKTKKFSCELCGNSFDSKNSKVQHIQNVHKRSYY